VRPAKRSAGKAGTGLVHTAPVIGHDDFVVGKSMPEIYCPVDIRTVHAEVEHFAGLNVFEATRRSLSSCATAGV